MTNTNTNNFFDQEENQNNENYDDLDLVSQLARQDSEDDMADDNGGGIGEDNNIESGEEGIEECDDDDEEIEDDKDVKEDDDIENGEEEASELDDQDELKTVEENIILPKSKAVLIKKLLANIKENNDRLLDLLSRYVSDEDEESIGIGQLSDENFEHSNEKISGSKIIEGVFDGENMIGPDGKQYNVPVNYASKSKMVEGDILKLTITDKGTFVYKQIGPIERIRVVGKLEQNGDGNYSVVANGKKWRILDASVTYFKGEEGDETVILVPKSGASKWGAVENIIKKKEID